MDLDSFYEQEFQDYEERPDKFCNICFCEHDSTSIKLKCGHLYHYECIKISYKMNVTKFPRGCPYCREDGGFLPLLENIKPEKGIHREYTSWLKNKEHICYKQCIGIIKNGPNKNSRCHNKTTGNYCGMHKKQQQKGITYKNFQKN